MFQILGEVPMRPMWQGTISFGLVNIPIKLYNGSDDPALGLPLLHNKDHSPVRYAKICRAEEKEIPSDEVVKGYQYQKREYVILSEKDFEKANVRSTHTIDIIKFSNEDEIDIRCFKKPYYLEPDKGSNKPYALLREALTQSKKVAIAKCVLHNREHLAVIKVIDGVLVLEFLRFANEIRQTNSLDIPKNISLSAQEIKMAVNLINQLAGHFKFSEFHDAYKEDLENLIQNKIMGKKLVRVKEKSPKVTAAKDLMSALKASLKKSKLSSQKQKVTKASAKKIKSHQKVA